MSRLVFLRSLFRREDVSRRNWPPPPSLPPPPPPPSRPCSSARPLTLGHRIHLGYFHLFRRNRSPTRELGKGDDVCGEPVFRVSTRDTDRVHTACKFEESHASHWRAESFEEVLLKIVYPFSAMRSFLLTFAEMNRTFSFVPRGYISCYTLKHGIEKGVQMRY